VTLVALVDTNVIVSGLLAAADDSPTARILDAMAVGKLHFILSDELLAEYRAVLLRPAIATRHGLTETEVDAVLEGIVANASWREPAASQDAPQAVPPRPIVPGDEHVLSLLEAEPRAVLVTGDRRLREAVTAQRPALTPAELAAQLDRAAR
jgi:predicted nucleic acid-binding protein